MTVKAFVLVEAGVEKSKEVVEALEKVKGVKSVDAVTGPYDFIVVVEEADVNSIGSVVTKGIHSVAGISRTITCIAIKLT